MKFQPSVRARLWWICTSAYSTRHGKLITGIPQTAFKVYENGVQQPIAIFNREDVPVSMGIVIDNSGSMRYKREEVAAAAMALVTSSNPQDEVFIVNFDDRPYLDLPFTNDLKKLQAALAQLKARGGTAMRDAISGSIDYMRKKATRDKTVLLVITDGNDNTSRVTLDQAVLEARQSGVLVYCIGILADEDFGEARSAKRRAQGAGGGLGRIGLLSQELEGDSEDHSGNCRGDPESVRAGLSTHAYGTGWDVPPDQGRGHWIRETCRFRTRSGYYATASAK